MASRTEDYRDIGRREIEKYNQNQSLIRMRYILLTEAVIHYGELGALAAANFTQKLDNQINDQLYSAQNVDGVCVRLNDELLSAIIRKFIVGRLIDPDQPELSVRPENLGKSSDKITYQPTKIPGLFIMSDHKNDSIKMQAIVGANYVEKNVMISQ